ncbi:sialidase-3.1 isoform X2 [Conger conger]|uniref:sialidase-3.1 isoform X2 n=1 Tax=Conger conger TaxID=82655 RepID=UPI002A5A8CDC|nr:sialidase-3.1 isoform X2 [Conger conger]
MGNTTSRRSSNRIAMEPEKTTVFKQEQTRGVTYRIPALIYLREAQTYLAFAEKRATPRDSDAKIIVMRKGTLLSGSIQSNTTEHHQVITGKNAARLCYISSKDNGLTWSKTKDLTDSVISKKVRNWATFAVGPGHGIQMESGRLVVPAYVYYIHCECACIPLPCSVKPHSLSFYSDDRGETWHVGHIIQRMSCECEMAEIIDRDGRSHLYCNSRNTSGHRVEALSETSGNTFDKPCLAPKLVEQCSGGCQGSVIGFPVPESLSEEQAGANKDDMNLPYSSDTQTWLLYSHPTNKRKRSDLGVYLNRSPLHTLGWEKPWIIHHGPSGYSDLAYCEGEQFACLMECGKESELEEIAFVDFHLNDVMEAINGKLKTP